MQPTHGDGFCGTVVGDEDAPFRNGSREKHLVLRRLGIEIHGPHYVPASSFQPLNQVIVDARVGEFSASELRAIERIVLENRERFLEAWNEFFSR